MIKLNRSKLSLKTMYYLTYIGLIVLPVLAVLLVLLVVLNYRFEVQAEENIQRMHIALATELQLDMETISLKLSHLVHTNSSEMLDFASMADTTEANNRYEYYTKLEQSVDFVLEPSTDLISLSFYMKDGTEIFISTQMEIANIREQAWYQSALEKKNRVFVGSYPIMVKDEAFNGSKRKSLLLIFALSPDITTDRNEKIENVVIYYTTGVSDKIEEYNRKFQNGENKLGITQIVDSEGDLIYSSDGTQNTKTVGVKCIRTPVRVNDSNWYIESYISHWQFTGDFRMVAMLAMAVTIGILTLSAYFSRFLIRSIVQPIEEISDGLRQVEEGNLDAHIEAQGQAEIRSMIHQFNAMVRRIRALIGEYEEKVKASKVRPEELLAAMIAEDMTPQEVAEKTKEFFSERYIVFSVFIEGNYNWQEVSRCFERNPRFVSRCVLCLMPDGRIFAIYRVTEDEYVGSLHGMIRDLQQEVLKKCNVSMSICISSPGNGSDDFYCCVREITEYMDYRFLFGERAIVDLTNDRKLIARVEALDGICVKLAKALYIADEKNVTEEREKIDALLRNDDLEGGQSVLLAVVLEIGREFSHNSITFSDIFGETSNYVEKIRRMDDLRSMKMWLTNYCAWIMDYSAAKLRISDTDVIVKAKRYIAEHYDNPELNLTKVAEHVGLNENYFTNRFTKETGETFLSYITTLRLQKARELLKTTTFKIYEIAEMVGYRNVEHFNRVFKKANGMSPAQYRKTM